jgi:WD40 repeat protein
LFDAATGEKLFVLQDECPSAGVDFSPDGSRIATVDSCNRVRVWAYGIDDLLHLARQVVTRSLTDAECHEFLHLARCPE